MQLILCFMLLNQNNGSIKHILCLILMANNNKYSFYYFINAYSNLMRHYKSLSRFGLVVVMLLYVCIYAACLFVCVSVVLALFGLIKYNII